MKQENEKGKERENEDLHFISLEASLFEGFLTLQEIFNSNHEKLKEVESGSLPKGTVLLAPFVPFVPCRRCKITRTMLQRL